MKKKIFVARSSNGNTDSCAAFFDKKDAEARARYWYGNLTASEKATNIVTVETYRANVSESDARDAETLFNDLLDTFDELIQNPVTFERIGEKEE